MSVRLLEPVLYSCQCTPAGRQSTLGTSPSLCASICVLFEHLRGFTSAGTGCVFERLLEHRVHHHVTSEDLEIDVCLVCYRHCQVCANDVTVSCAMLQVVAVKAPGFGERKTSYLEDIAILTGGQLVKDELGINLEKAGEEVLGVAAKVGPSGDMGWLPYEQFLLH